MPKLIISGTPHELMDEAITIGRGPDNTIVVNDPSISDAITRNCSWKATRID